MAEYTVKGYRLKYKGTVYSRGQTVNVEDKDLAKRLLDKGVVGQQGDDTRRAAQQGSHPDQQRSSKSERKSSE